VKNSNKQPRTVCFDSSFRFPGTVLHVTAVLLGTVSSRLVRQAMLCHDGNVERASEQALKQRARLLGKIHSYAIRNTHFRQQFFKFLVANKVIEIGGLRPGSSARP
jgi:hypothetical protein